MSSPDLESLNRLLADAVFPQNLDEKTATLVRQQQINLPEFAQQLNGLLSSGGDGAWNRACFVLNRILGNRNQQPGEHRWAAGNLLQLLMATRDPRQPLMRGLLDVYRQLVESSTAAGVAETEKENIGQMSRRLDVLKRARSTWYPRARQQVNSKSYITAALGLDETAARPLPEDTTFFVLGTCFAENIHAAFAARGLAAEMISHGEESPVEMLFADLAGKEAIARRIEETPRPCFIFTLGFAEFDIPDFKSVSGSTRKFDAFHTPEFISQCILDGAEKLRALNENIRIFLTVSPVPLEGTSSSFNIFEANAISKSIIRLAVAMACNTDPALDYFPSYEIVTQIAPSAGHCPFGDDDGHPRHVNQALVALICALFMETYCPWLAGGRG